MRNRKYSTLTTSIFILIVVSALIIPSLVIAQPLFSIPEIPPFPTIISNGNTYHVDGDHPAAANLPEYGTTEDTPFKTLKYGIDKLEAGDTLIIHDADPPYGEYRIIDKAGESDNWITIKGDEDEDVLIVSPRPFELTANAHFIYLANLRIEVTLPNAAIGIATGATNIVMDDIELDGGNNGSYGIHIGQQNTPPAVKNCYFRNLDIHHFNGQGVKFFNPVENIVFDQCKVHHNGMDGISGRAWRAHEHKNKDIYFVDSESYQNDGDGFDIGVDDGVNVFKNCVSRENGPAVQGNGFKIWSKDAWLINSLTYKNAFTAVSYKPYADESKIYILNSTFVGDNEDHSIGQIRMPAYSTSEGQLFGTISAYLYNNIFYPPVSPATRTKAVHLENQCRQTLAGEDNNYYFSDDNGIAFKFSSYVNPQYVDCEGVPERYYTFTEMGDGTWYDAEPCGPGVECGGNDIGKVKTVEDPDPGFSDLAIYDLSLAQGSLAIDAGTDTGTSYDIDGYPRPIDGDDNSIAAHDMGAFEYCMNPPVRIVNDSTEYYSIQDVYDAAQNGDYIENISGKFSENLNVDQNKSITLDGGYDCGYTIKTGVTILNGNMMISSGTLTIGGVVLDK